MSLLAIKRALGANPLTGPAVRAAKRASVALARARGGRRPVNPTAAIELQTLGIPGRHVFFGYHDVSPADPSDRLALAGAVDARGGGPAGASLDVGCFDLDASGGFVKFDTTPAWCWQMGARLQWLGREGQRCIYNSTSGGRHVAVVYDAAAGRRAAEIERPVYSVAPSGRQAVSLDFTRLQRLRPGYGYQDLPESSARKRIPADDGLWLVDLERNRSELLLSCAEAAGWSPVPGSERAEHYFNHVVWSPDSRRFLFLHLLAFDDGSRSGRAWVYDVGARRATPVELSGYVSHFAWRNEREILMYSRSESTGTGLNLYDVDDGTVRAIGRDAVLRDCHPMFSPADPDIIVADSYPRRPYFERELFVLDIERGKRIDLLSLYSPVRFAGEERCDLHPRWDRAGRRVFVDSVHAGVRQLCVVDAAAAV